jgi:TetR/AcrR family transcriptional repressor of mexJK operon
VSAPARRGTGGRPTAAAAAQLEATILEYAIAAFLAEGYAATSIEAIAKACGVAKRTIYARWDGKPALFKASVAELLNRWAGHAGPFTDSNDIEACLRDAARRMLAVALTPEAVALHRLLVAESGRFPELPNMIREAGASMGQQRIVDILQRAVDAGALPAHDVGYAAEQFMHLVLTGPQMRALGLRSPFDAPQMAAWADRAVALFLHGAVS